MAVTRHSGVDSAAARRVWEEFQRQHDLSGRQGQTAGIESANGRVWIGDSIETVIQQRDADGCDAPLYFVRVGSPVYNRKGGRRRLGEILVGTRLLRRHLLTIDFPRRILRLEKV